jgi:hypothetical protein
VAKAMIRRSLEGFIVVVALAVTVPALASAADCICMTTNIKPNLITLTNVGTGGKGSSGTKTLTVTIHAADAPGATCDTGESSDPVSANLRLVDDDGDVLLDSAKTIVCGPPGSLSLNRIAFFQSPLNCENSAVPSGNSFGDIFATSTIDADVYEETLTLKCSE